MQRYSPRNDSEETRSVFELPVMSCIGTPPHSGKRSLFLLSYKGTAIIINKTVRVVTDYVLQQKQEKAVAEKRF